MPTLRLAISTPAAGGACSVCKGRSKRRLDAHSVKRQDIASVALRHGTDAKVGFTSMMRAATSQALGVCCECISEDAALHRMASHGMTWDGKWIRVALERCTEGFGWSD